MSALKKILLFSLLGMLPFLGVYAEKSCNVAKIQLLNQSGQKYLVTYLDPDEGRWVNSRSVTMSSPEEIMAIGKSLDKQGDGFVGTILIFKADHRGQKDEENSICEINVDFPKGANARIGVEANCLRNGMASDKYIQGYPCGQAAYIRVIMTKPR